MIRREKQNILVVHENTTSDTSTCQIEKETRKLFEMPSESSVSQWNQSLDHQQLYRQILILDLLHCYKITSYIVIHKVIQEVEEEIIKQEPCGGRISPTCIALANSSLNSRIHHTGLSTEIWTQRDQYTNEQLPISDLILIQSKHNQSSQNHSEHSKTLNSLMLSQRV